MSINLNGFQACDVRGRYGNTADSEISPMHARLIGRGLAQRVPVNERLLIAGDGRASTPALLSALAAGFGRPLLNLGTGIPTPLAYLAKQQSGAHASAFVTASHNPPEFNGIKIQLGAWPVTPADIAALRDAVGALAQDGAVPPAIECDMLPLVDADLLARVWIDYKTAVRNAFQSPAGMPIAVDCMHGCYSRYAVEILDKMGFRAAMLRDEPRGDFGGATPDPSADRNLVPLSAAIAAGRYAFGAALDGDGDRVRFVDEHGAPVDNGTILVLLARYVIESGRDGGRRKVIYDQKTRLAVVQALRAIGTEPVMAKSGHTFIRTRMLREGALMAGEKSGHFFWGGGAIYPVDSGDCGLFAVLALGAALRFFDQPLATLAATVPPSPFYTGDIRGLKYDGDRHALLAGIARKIDTRRYRVDTEDGVRIETPAAFAHLRASVTESDMLTASFDAASWSELEGVANELLRRLPAEAAALKRALAERIMGLKP